MPVAFLGIGSNLRAEQNLKLAVRELRKRFTVKAISPVYRSKALGFEGADFLNAVACIETELAPIELHTILDEIHEQAGRRRGNASFVSRTLDIDLLLYDQCITSEPPVILPRKDVLDYSFVLKPLADIAPHKRHPVTRRSYADHWREFDAARHPLTLVNLSL